MINQGGKQMKKCVPFLVLTFIFALVLATCGGGDNEESDTTEKETETSERTDEAGEEEAENGESYVIGATQIVEHPSLDRAYEGFQAAIADAGLDVEYDFQSAQNDPNNVKPISDGF